jgi:nucleotide-binding universal stress UspA family protein
MAFTLLVGYDGSECSDGAIMELARAGLPEEGEAIIATVADVWPHLPAESFRELKAEELAQLPSVARRAHLLASAAMAEARQTAGQGARLLAEVLPKWTVRQQVAGGSPPDVLLKAAAEARAGLIQVGSRGKGAVERAVLGSTSLKVMAYAGRSVRVARGRGCQVSGGGARVVERGPVKLIVGVDGSAGSAEAIKVVAGRRWPSGSQVRVVGTIEARVTTVPVTELEMAGWAVDLAAAAAAEGQQWMQQVVDAAAAKLGDTGLVVETRVVDGDPKRVLVAEAETWGADCIFVGARGLSRLERFLIGTVASTVVSRAHCSVEVVRKLTGAA